MVSLDDIHVDKHLNYVERLITILDRKTKSLCNKVVGLVNVQWKHRKGSSGHENLRRRCVGTMQSYLS